jgi:hypothetical protein
MVNAYWAAVVDCPLKCLGVNVLALDGGHWLYLKLPMKGVRTCGKS